MNFQNWPVWLVSVSCAFMILLAGLIGSPRPTTNFPQGDQPPREQLSQKSEYNQSGSKLVTSVRIECDPNCSKSDSDEEANSVYITRLFKKFFSDPVAILTLPIMLANIVLVLIVRGQFRDGKEAVRAAQISAEAAMTALGSDRAWLSFDGIDFGQMSASILEDGTWGDAISCRIRWRNKGRSPALKANTFIDYRVIDISDEVTIQNFSAIWSEFAQTFCIGPEGTANTRFRAISSTETGNFFNRKISWIVYSEVSYVDIFNSNILRTSSACIRVIINGQIVEDGVVKPNYEIMAFGSQNTMT